MAAGLATGLTLAIELNRASRHRDHYSLPWEALFSAIRAAAFSAALYPQVGLNFAIVYGILVTGGQVLAYVRGVRPSLRVLMTDVRRFTKVAVVSTLLRTSGYMVAALICSRLVRHLDHPWLFATRLGVVTGIVTAVGLAFSPHIESYADNLPARRMGVVGVVLMFFGFAMQSMQYWIVVLDVRVS